MENQAEASKENAILVDWLTVVLHGVEVSDVQRVLGLDAADIDWEDRLAFRHGYPRQFTFANICIRYGADNIENYKDTEKSTAAQKVRFDMGICLDMSGNACRAFETYGHGDWIKLFSGLCDMGTKVNFTRIDLAYDDHTGVLDLNRIRLDVEDRNFTGVPRKAMVLWSDDQKEDIQGLTCYIGSEKSAVFIRIYDKAAERGFKDRHWVRVELQLRIGRAIAAVAEILKEQDVGRTFSGVMRNYCCFREPSGDSNKSRWPIAPYWEALLNGIERIRLCISPGEPYNFRKTEEQMVYQYGQAIQAYIAIHGTIDTLIRACYKAHPQLKTKYKVAINEARQERKRATAALNKLRYDLGIYEFDLEEFPLITDQMDMAEIFGDELKSSL